MPHILDEPKADERSNGQTIKHIKMLAKGYHHCMSCKDK